MPSEAEKLPPAGDTPRRVADSFNVLAEMVNKGAHQVRTVAQLANEEHDNGRSFLCPDDTDGPCLAVSYDGDWLKITLGAEVSA